MSNRKKSEEKYIKIALDLLGWRDEDGLFKTYQDIKDLISQYKLTKQTCVDQIDILKENIEKCDEQIEALTDILNQSEIEEFREMNPKAKGIYKI
jgi:hypothetical protein